MPDILRLVGLSTKLHNLPDELSGGEQQRVSIARAFVNHPPLLLADEPTGNLDPETSIGIMQLIYRINRTGTTVIVATHDNEMVDKMRRRVVELREGRIVRDERVRPLPPRRVDDRVRDPPARRAGRGRRGPPQLACASASSSGGPPRPAAQLRAGARGAADRAAHRARAGRVHPDRPGHHGHRQRGAQPRRRRRLREGLRHRVRPDRRSSASSRPRPASSRSSSSRRTRRCGSSATRSTTPRTRSSCSAATRCPSLLRVTPEDPDELKTIVAQHRARRARRSFAAIDEVRNRESDTDKILSATGLVKGLGAVWRCCWSSPRSR